MKALLSIPLDACQDWHTQFGRDPRCELDLLQQETLTDYMTWHIPRSRILALSPRRPLTLADIPYQDRFLPSPSNA